MQRPDRFPVLPALILALAAACSNPSDPTISALCVAQLNFEGRLYGQLSMPSPPLTPGAAVGVVTRNVGCNDTPEEGDPPFMDLQPGESNPLAEGTVLYEALGFPVSQRLMHYSDEEDLWLVMTAEPLSH